MCVMLLPFYVDTTHAIEVVLISVFSWGSHLPFGSIMDTSHGLDYHSYTRLLTAVPAVNSPEFHPCEFPGLGRWCSCTVAS